MTRLLASVLLYSFSIQAIEPIFPGEEWNVFGDDDRKPILSSKYPWTTIGKLSVGCTGTLVGPDLVLTAAHCIEPDPGTFSPNFMNGQAKDTSEMTLVAIGTEDPDASRKDDWALLRLAKPLGKKYGWMGTDSHEFPSFYVAGYATNFRQGQTAGVHADCGVRRRTKPVFYHDCDSGRGASGGPVFVFRNGYAYIVGLNVAEYRAGGDESLKVDAYSDSHANIALPASTFIHDIKRLR